MTVGRRETGGVAHTEINERGGGGGGGGCKIMPKEERRARGFDFSLESVADATNNIILSVPTKIDTRA